MAAVSSREVADGLIAVAVANISTLAAVASPYGVTIDASMAPDQPTEYLHFRKGDRGDLPLGLTVEILEGPIGQAVWGGAQTVSKVRSYSLIIRSLWRDTIDLKLTDTPKALGEFMGKFTEALSALFDISALGTVGGAWTTSGGVTVLSPQVTSVDADAIETEIRHTLCHATEIVFNCFALWT